MPASSTLMLELRLAAHALDDASLGLTAYRQSVARALQQRFQCSMASLWVFQGDQGQRRLHCVAAFSNDPDLSAEGMDLHETVFPVYFDTLRRSGVYSASDAQNDANLAGMKDSYLVPQNVHALLDVAYQINGQLTGVLCIEQRDTPRAWTRNDAVELRKAASAIGMSIARLQSSLG